jgi:hypothetical protein
MANTFKNLTSRNVGDTFVAVNSYAVPGATIATVIGLSVANLLSPTEIIVDAVLRTGGNDTHLVKGIPVPAGSTVVIVGGNQKLVLTAGDSVRVKSSEATSADVIMSVLEVS